MSTEAYCIIDYKKSDKNRDIPETRKTNGIVAVGKKKRKPNSKEFTFNANSAYSSF